MLFCCSLSPQEPKLIRSTIPAAEQLPRKARSFSRHKSSKSEHQYLRAQSFRTRTRDQPWRAQTHRDDGYGPPGKTLRTRALANFPGRGDACFLAAFLRRRG
ncbi:hypothetical protein ZWY2020_029825 [Hordeum vulgare]|nr:hypothetical protein ZWY2020_029825 [Hordeum vulgare]